MREKATVLLIFIEIYLIMRVDCILGPFHSPNKSITLSGVFAKIPLVLLGCTRIPHRALLFVLIGLLCSSVFENYHTEA